MHEKESITTGADVFGKRFDQVVSELLPDYSRSRVQQWIKQGLVLLNGKPAKAKEKMRGGEIIEIDVDFDAEDSLDENWIAEDIPLNIVYEDEDVIVINKPAGLVVHPGAGNPQGTLLNALLHHEPALASVPRAGVIHRLDKETTGLLVVARNLKSHAFLVEELQERNFEREYRALVCGVMTAGGTVEEPIGRHPTMRTRMAVVRSGKHAVTHYRVEQRYRAHSLLRVNLETGRTHQIRVHLAHINFPIVGDPVYGGRLMFPKGSSEALNEALREFKRQALHAARLGILHPRTGQEMSWEAPIPEDMQHLIDVMETDCHQDAD